VFSSTCRPDWLGNWEEEYRVHTHRTSALPIGRRGRAMGLAALVALLCSSAPLAAAMVQAEEPSITSSIDRNPSGDIRIQFVKSGREGLELSARLSESGGTIERPVFWTVRRKGGDIVYQGEEPVADLVTEPGDYDVTARYGTVTVARSVVLLERQRLGISLVFNVGGLRVLPKVAMLGLPMLRAETRIYATSGSANGRMIAISTVPGEILRLGAGTYRIESRFTPGNASEVASVDIKPGLLSAVELELPAGIARLAVPGSGSGVIWTIEPASGDALPPIEGALAEFALKPGKYLARARIGDAERRIEFSIAPGETRDIISGN
jgi:hypothetical protein